MTQQTEDRVELDLDALEKVALAATQGEWVAFDEIDGSVAPTRIVARTIAGIRTLGRTSAMFGRPHVRREEVETNAAHIATFDPPTVLRLIALARTGVDPVVVQALGLAQEAREYLERSGGYAWTERLTDILTRLAALPAHVERGEIKQGVSSSRELSLAASGDGGCATYDELSDTLWFTLRDRPTFHRFVYPGLDTLHDMDSREPIGWRIYGWSKIKPSGESAGT